MTNSVRDGEKPSLVEAALLKVAVMKGAPRKERLASVSSTDTTFQGSLRAVQELASTSFLSRGSLEQVSLRARSWAVFHSPGVDTIRFRHECTESHAHAP